MPSHDPARKKKSFRVTKRRKSVAPSPQAGMKPATTTYNYEFPSSESVELHESQTESQLPLVIGSMNSLAPLVWQDDYALLFKLEQLALEANYGLMTATHLVKSLAGISTYAARGLSRKSESEKADLQGDQQLSIAVQAMRQANQQRHSFSVLVRSLHALSKRTPDVQWRRQNRLRALVSKPTAITFLKMVMEVGCSSR